MSAAAQFMVANMHGLSEAALVDLAASGNPDVRDAAQRVLDGLAGTLIEHRASMEDAS
ncbi:hypothetical protein BH10PSE17_BH10PSE17_25200 [soil metagenome]